MESYKFLAKYYSYLMKGDGVEEWEKFVAEKIKYYAGENSFGVDVGCGTGNFTRALKNAGHEVFGIDNSGEMLQVALEGGGDIMYLKQDICKLSLLKKQRFITAINDVLNYIPKEKFISALKKIKGSLAVGGIFMFDLSSKYKLEKVIGDNFFGVDDEDISYLWFNKLLNDKLEMDLTFFIKQGGVYVKREERHVQYIYSEEEIEKALLEVGFEILEKSGHMGKEINPESERINYIVKSV